MDKVEVTKAHQFAIRNRESILKSDHCGCCYCLNIFKPSEIVNWVIDRDEKTAVCPYCEADSVIGSASGYEITSDFLKEMKEHWFATAQDPR